MSRRFVQIHWCYDSKSKQLVSDIMGILQKYTMIDLPFKLWILLQKKGKQKLVFIKKLSLVT